MDWHKTTAVVLLSKHRAKVLHVAPNGAAMHWSQVLTKLYEKCIFRVVIEWHKTAASLLAQQHRVKRLACCPEKCCSALVPGAWHKTALHSTEQQGMHFAVKSAVVHWYLVLTNLHQEWIV